MHGTARGRRHWSTVHVPSGQPGPGQKFERVLPASRSGPVREETRPIDRLAAATVRRPPAIRQVFTGVRTHLTVWTPASDTVGHGLEFDRA